tara:strand:+ start:9129 stop:9440 length:312 start_codon:yes stop_codon:yes gene_type:complete
MRVVNGVLRWVGLLDPTPDLDPTPAVEPYENAEDLVPDPDDLMRIARMVSRARSVGAHSVAARAARIKPRMVPRQRTVEPPRDARTSEDRGPGSADDGAGDRG